MFCFLVLGITGDADNFHAVQQGAGNVERVGGGQKHHLGQVEVHLQVMVIESVVLLRVQHFQQRR